MFVLLIQCAMVVSVVLPNWSLYLLSYHLVPLLTNQTIDYLVGAEQVSARLLLKLLMQQVACCIKP